MKNLFKKLSFLKKNYFVTTLVCGLKYKKQLDKKKEKLIKELSDKSNELLSKGTDYQHDIGNLNTKEKSLYNFDEFDQKVYNIFINSDKVDLYCWKYKLYDIKDKTIKNCKIWSPYDQFIKGSFSFRRELP